MLWCRNDPSLHCRNVNLHHFLLLISVGHKIANIVQNNNRDILIESSAFLNNSKTLSKNSSCPDFVTFHVNKTFYKQLFYRSYVYKQCPSFKRQFLLFSCHLFSQPPFFVSLAAISLSDIFYGSQTGCCQQSVEKFQQEVKWK